MRISNNFRMREFSVSVSYPHLAKGVPVEFQPNVRALVLNLLQPICDATGWICQISSGYRSPELNKAVGGAKTSQHLRGEASDNIFKNTIRIPSYEVLKKVVELGLDFDQMIAYPTFVHLSYRKGMNRKQILYSKSYKGKRL